MDAHRNAMPKPQTGAKPPLTVERVLTLERIIFRPRKNGCRKKWSSVYLALVSETQRCTESDKSVSGLDVQNLVLV